MHRLFFVLILLVSSNVSATDIANLYQSSVPVATQGEEERLKVAPIALQQVLLKIVGDRAALNKVDVASLLLRADSLIQQYQYRQVNKISDDITAPEQLEVVLSFNESALNNAMRDLSLPLWSKSRPEVLVWLSVDNGGKRTILSADDVNKTSVKALKHAADLRGLPVLMPVMDLQDQSQVKVANLWAGVYESVESASQRYGSPVILMAKATIKANGTSLIRWHSLINGESKKWQSRGNINNAMRLGLDKLTNHLARRFSQVVSNNQYASRLSLQISNVKNYDDYSRTMAYLKSLQYVSDLTLISLSKRELSVSLNLKGNLSIFKQTLTIDRMLVSESNSTEDALNYRLN